MVTLESVLEYHNMKDAMTQVIKNRGAAGFDGIPVSELEQWFREHPHQLSKAVMSGTYKPQPIKRVYIPKDNGDKRPLGIQKSYAISAIFRYHELKIKSNFLSAAPMDQF